jgi:hypothetical protein
VRRVWIAVALSGCAAATPGENHLPHESEVADAAPADDLGPLEPNAEADATSPEDGSSADASPEAEAPPPLVTDELPYRTAHPAPRVKVDVTKVTGHVQAGDVQATARSKGYWPIRRCYDEGLRRAPRLHGEMVVRVGLGRDGSVREVHRVSTHIDDRDVVACLRKALRRLSLAAPSRGTATATIGVSVWPGDEPVSSRAAEEPWPARPAELQASLHSHLAEVEACYREGLARHAELSGRIALRLRVAATGEIREATEVESLFPDPGVKKCIVDQLRKAKMTAPGKELVFIYPLRLGLPPEQARAQ